MNRLCIHPYFLAPVAILFAACENSINDYQGESVHVFKRSASGEIIEKKVEKDVPQKLPDGVFAVDGPKVKTIINSNPTREAPVSSNRDSKVAQASATPRRWHNPDNVVIAALGSKSSGQNQKRTTYSEQTTDPKLGYIYYKIWTPIGREKPHYPGILDEDWSQANGSQANGDTDKSGLELATTALQVGSVKLINDKSSTIIKIRGTLAQEMTYPGGKKIPAGTSWTWTGTWHSDPRDQKPANPCKNLYGRGTLTWRDVPPQ